MAAPCGFSIWTEKLYDGQGLEEKIRGSTDGQSQAGLPDQGVEE
jgi:hypothetical protein